MATATTNNWPWHKQQAAIIDYDSDQSADAPISVNNMTNSNVNKQQAVQTHSNDSK